MRRDEWDRWWKCERVEWIAAHQPTVAEERNAALKLSRSEQRRSPYLTCSRHEM